MLNRLSLDKAELEKVVDQTILVDREQGLSVFTTKDGMVGIQTPHVIIITTCETWLEAVIQYGYQFDQAFGNVDKSKVN